MGFRELAEAVITGKAAEVERLVNAALAGGIKPTVIVNRGLIAGMEVIADRFKKNEIYLPEVLVAARAMTAGLTILKPLIAESDVPPAAKVVIGTVKGDLHDIGKKVVSMMLQGAGFDVVDLGIDISPEQFVDAVRTHQPSVLGMSALLTTTMPAMAKTIEALKQAELRDKVKVIIGGAPITDAYAKEIGADGYAPDAGSAVDVVRKLVAA